jgi:hypothetical protein
MGASLHNYRQRTSAFNLTTGQLSSIDMASQISAKRQQGNFQEIPNMLSHFTDCYLLELQVQYSNFKGNLQQIAQKIGDVEQETEEHKYVLPRPTS